ncbi:hypothetical protein BVRB_5g116010 [Beta vulgaris subsp. vulgaris]|nr:hypothetical protein BVRB_5g116010 [Beta vulgaris subsp. vulgaris]
MAEVGSNSENEDVCNLEEPLLDHVDLSSNSKANVRCCDTVTPYENASLFSTLTFSWLSPLLTLAAEKTTLDLDDIPQLGTANSVFRAFPKFKTRLHKSLSLDNLDNNIGTTTSSRIATTEFGLAKVFFLSAWKEILWTGFLAIMYTIACYVAPYLIDNFITCLNGKEEFKNQGYILAFTFCAANFLDVFIWRHYIFVMQQVGIRFRGVTTVMIYNKCLNLPYRSSYEVEDEQSSRGTAGELINVVASDVESIKDYIVYMHDTWLIFLQIGLALLILYNKLGLLASVGALFVTVSFMLLNSVFIRWQEKFQKKLMESKDDRMKMTMETLRNMRVLRFQGWETNFLSKILQLRTLETQWLKKYLYSSAIMNFFYGIGPNLVALATFSSCIYIGIPLNTGKILSALATFRVLREPINLLPETISLLIQAKVSLGRITSFLSLEELREDRLQELTSGSSDASVEIVDGNFTWEDISSPPTSTLKDINLRVSHGMKVGICGSVGSGKSSLLSCILGEMPKISGMIKLCGTKAYVAQSPWIQSGTVQDNILFSKQMDRERYDQILEACCLKKDLEILSYGDQTVIGERGINLSGGQKQRVQIARALYHNVDIFLFDDPFSAVDVHTGSHLYKEVLLDLLREKTVIYVTHQVDFLKAADLVVVMKDGRIAQVGKYDDILVPGSDFAQLVGAQNAAMPTSTLDSTTPTRAIETGDTTMSSVSNGVVNAEADDDDDDDGDAKLAPPAISQLVKEEEREKGSVEFLVYWEYITTTYGGVLVLLTFLALILLEILQIGSNYWLASAIPGAKSDDKHVVNGFELMIVYVCLAIGICICTIVVDMLVLTTGYKTATLLFTKMLQSIFRAPMSFYEATPTGRILNRQSYMQLSRELSRLSRICEAPVIQFFSETISGITTIRSFDQESRFQLTYMKIVDAYSRPDFHLAAVMKWLMLRLDAFSCITLAFLLVLSLYFADRINPEIAGLAVTYGLTLNSRLPNAIWSLCHWQTKMISVERILQFLSIPSEAPLIIEENRPDCSWPSHGEIRVQNLKVRYAPHLPLVLHGVTCTFPGAMKTGIVGRTGSGKSTLIQALFRIVEPTAGQIVIDGIDISSIGLEDLRSRLSIIPQDPTMFQGTLRSNLDPLEQYTDEQIWDTLDKCQLGDQVRKMERKLDSNVHENGENWSMGQKQLVCLGRVLLKKSKVLILDEATASVDTTTDNLIQITLKRHFHGCTLITIAHRMTSVLDSDMVLLLSHGVVQEYDSPTTLLQNKSSSFSQLVAACTKRSSYSNTSNTK